MPLLVKVDTSYKGDKYHDEYRNVTAVQALDTGIWLLHEDRTTTLVTFSDVTTHKTTRLEVVPIHDVVN